MASIAASSPIAVRTMTSRKYSLVLISFSLQNVSQLTGVLALLSEELGDLVTNFTVGELDVVLGGAVIVHEGEETVVSDVDLVTMSA